MALLMLAEGRGTTQALQSILGSLGYPLSVKKMCLSDFGSSYRWVDSLRDKKVYPIPWQVRHEILLASLLFVVRDGRLKITNQHTSALQ